MRSTQIVSLRPLFNVHVGGGKRCLKRHRVGEGLVLKDERTTGPGETTTDDDISGPHRKSGEWENGRVLPGT